MPFTAEVKPDSTKKSEEKNPLPKKKVPIYIPKILQDIIWASTKNSTCVQFGFGHMFQKHRTMFDLKHVQECDLIQGCPDIAHFAKKIKEEGNIRLWKEEEILKAVA